MSFCRPAHAWGQATALLTAGIFSGVLVCAPVLLNAQDVQSSIELGSSRLHFADSIRMTAATVTPAVLALWDRSSIAASASYSHLTGGSWSIHGGGFGSVLTARRGLLQGELAASGGGSKQEEGISTAIVLGALRGHVRGNAAGVWLGGGGGTASDGDEWRPTWVGELGGWASRGGLSGSLVVAPTGVRDTIRVRYTDLLFRGRFGSERLEVGASVGVREGRPPNLFGDSPRSWGSGDLVAWLTRRIGVVVAGGRYPVDFTQGYPGGTYASVSLRIRHPSPATSSREPPPPVLSAEAAAAGVVDFRVGDLEGGLRRIEIRAPGARAVELNGALTGWRPVALSPGLEGWWGVSLNLLPGLYETVVRTDAGEWIAPPGVVTVRDEFGGTAGIVRID